MLRTSTLLLLSLLIWSGCQDDYTCIPRDTLAQFDDWSSEPGTIVPDDLTVRYAPDLQDQASYRIATQGEYDQLATFNQLADCADCNFPAIDFDTYTLLGYYFTTTCETVSVVKYSRIDENSYRMAVKLVDPTLCDNAAPCSRASFHWRLVPRLADDATVSLESGRSYFDCDCD